MQYFSQNDPAWKKEKLGPSVLTIGDYGCTTTCIANALQFSGEKLKVGYDVTPAHIAKMKEIYTKEGLINWTKLNFETLEFEWRQRSFSYDDEKKIDKMFLDDKKLILLNVNNGSHWVMMFGKKIWMKGYKALDPYPYPAVVKRFNNITGYCILRIKDGC